jgi:hypothetical protein
MADVHKSWKNVSIPLLRQSLIMLTMYIQCGSGGSDDEEGAHDEEVAAGSNTHGLSEFDYGLARFRGLLERRYGNDSNGGYSFVCVDGTTLPLTPLMMKEWARACVSP